MRCKTAELCRDYAKTLLLVAQRGLCPICGQQLPERITANRLTFDHVWPRAGLKGQSEVNLGNILLTHRRCNGTKGHRRPTGCELIQLQTTNRRLGLPERLTAHWERPL